MDSRYFLVIICVSICVLSAVENFIVMFILKRKGQETAFADF